MYAADHELNSFEVRQLVEESKQDEATLLDMAIKFDKEIYARELSYLLADVKGETLDEKILRALEFDDHAFEKLMKKR